MNVLVNGRDTPVGGGATTIRDLVSELKLTPETLLIELNGTALHCGEWSQPVRDGDVIEFLRVAAGG